MNRESLPAKRARPVAGGGGSEATGTPGICKPTNSPRRGDGNRQRTTETPTACFLSTTLQRQGGNAAGLAHPVPRPIVTPLRGDIPATRPASRDSSATRSGAPPGRGRICIRPGVPLTAFASPPATRRARSAGKSTTETARTPLGGLLRGLPASLARIDYLNAPRIHATGSSGWLCSPAAQRARTSITSPL